MNDKFYHTQENRGIILDKPIICKSDSAWMGEAYYFWYDENDAQFWGNVSKRRTGQYSVYSAIIISDDILDTVFNQEQYLFWIKQIEKAAKAFIKKANMKPTLKELNEYFRERDIWTEIDGILFQDISKNPVHFLVEEFQYKKRIQLAVYNDKIITTFAHHFDCHCV
jgi:hypothetical protein